MQSRKTIVYLSASALLLTGCGLDDSPASGSGASVVDDETEVAETEEAAATEAEATEEEGEAEEAEEAEEAGETGEDAALGTRDNPLELGTRIEMGDWTIAVVDVDVEATDRIMEENEYNDPPADGRTFVMFGVEATYEGDDSGDPWLDFSWAIVGGGGNTFGTGTDDYCGSIPDPLSDQGETYPGGSVSGNECIAVPVDQLEGSTLRVEELLSFDDTRAFYAID